MQAIHAPNGKAYLNIGCGTKFSPDWNNLDLNPQPGVILHNVLNALPYEPDQFDATYSSHVLEHLTPPQGRFFVAEQFRVLNKGGYCRIAVPDLEKVVRDYLVQLDAAERESDPRKMWDYQWTVLQLVDQQTREECGGEMLKTLHDGKFNADFVQSRCGDEFASFLPRAGYASGAPAPEPVSVKSVLRPIKRAVWKSLGWQPTARNTGEAHRWMYDRLSLRLLLTGAGFTDFKVVGHLESGIPDWAQFHLDTSDRGDGPRKPDSLFVEARKP